LSQLLSLIQTKEKDAYLLGDYNIDLLKYRAHKLTSNFSDMTASNNVLSIITRSTRIRPAIVLQSLSSIIFSPIPLRKLATQLY